MNDRKDEIMQLGVRILAKLRQAGKLHEDSRQRSQPQQLGVGQASAV